MARVTATKVKEVVNTNIADDVINRNHIATATAMVDEHLVGVGLSDTLLEKVELYLAAHFVALTEEGGSLTRNKLGDADTSYANIYSQGLNSTRFGQQALSIDSTGTLSRVAQTQLKADFRVV